MPSPPSKMLPVPILRFGLYSSLIPIPVDPHSFRGDPSTLKKYQISIILNHTSCKIKIIVMEYQKKYYQKKIILNPYLWLFG
jgi:hypothetical protein